MVEQELAGLSVSPTSDTVSVGGTTTLASGIDQFGDAMSTSVSWSSSNAIATIDTGGTVRGCLKARCP